MRRTNCRDLLEFYFYKFIIKMSRIGRKPVVIPEGVQIDIDENERKITVKWPKGQLDYIYPEGVIVNIEDNIIKVSIKDDIYKNLWWLVRTLINNMIEGVTKWFEKKLLVVWTGYNAKVQGKKLILNLGYSHPIEHEIPSDLEIKTEKDPKWNDIIIISWIDKQKVGQEAAVIRSYRKPEPYKGKWIRYIDEVIKLKPWKAAKK